jgi:cytidine deaminase
MNRYLRLALRESYKSNERSKHGAVIVKGHSVVAKAFNVNKTHPKWGGGPLGSLHAEGACIRKAVQKIGCISGAVIYVARSENRFSKPCKDCQKLIDQHNLRVVHT